MTRSLEDPTTVHEQKRRSVGPYLKFVRRLDPEVDLDTRTDHIAYDPFEDGIEWLIEGLRAADVSAGISVPAVYLDDETVRNAIDRLADAGNELVVHGYRHTSYMETPYEVADEELAAVFDRFESTLGVRPRGFHVPFMRCSLGTARAAEERGIEWIAGAEPPESEPSIPFSQPVSPYDIQLFEQGRSGREVTARMAEIAEPGSLLLAHPNVHAARGAEGSFCEWLEANSFGTPSAVASGDVTKPGLLLDCFPPFRVG